jgi:general secretion pathway protein J
MSRRNAFRFVDKDMRRCMRLLPRSAVMMRIAGRTRGRRERAAGFTLVELLVALALFGLLTTVLFATIRFGMNAWTRGTAHIEQTDETLRVQNLLRSLIENAYPLFQSTSNEGGHVDFDGASTSVSLLSANPIALGMAGRSHFRLSAEPHGDLTDLRLTSIPELALPGVSSRPAAEMLLAGAEKVAFSYFGQRNGDRSAAWVSTWSGEAALPQLVRVEITFPAHDGRDWPQLLVAPHITADVSCTYDPLTGRCRGR